MNKNLPYDLDKMVEDGHNKDMAAGLIIRRSPLDYRKSATIIAGRACWFKIFATRFDYDVDGGETLH